MSDQPDFKITVVIEGATPGYYIPQFERLMMEEQIIDYLASKHGPLDLPGTFSVQVVFTEPSDAPVEEA